MDTNIKNIFSNQMVNKKKSNKLSSIYIIKYAKENEILSITLLFLLLFPTSSTTRIRGIFNLNSELCMCMYINHKMKKKNLTHFLIKFEINVHHVSNALRNTLFLSVLHSMTFKFFFFCVLVLINAAVVTSYIQNKTQTHCNFYKCYAFITFLH